MSMVKCRVTCVTADGKYSYHWTSKDNWMAAGSAMAYLKAGFQYYTGMTSKYYQRACPSF